MAVLEQLSMKMAKISEQRHLRAIRDGIVSTLPLIIVGSVFLILAFPPFPKEWGISVLAKKYAVQMLLPYRMTMFIMGLYAVMGIGYSLAKSYKLDGITGAILSVCAFLLTIMPKMINPVEVINQTINGQAVQIIVEEGTKGSQLLQEDLGYVMQMSKLGSAGLFVGIIVAIFAVEVYRLTTTTGFKIRMPEAVPESVARSFEALTPAAIIIFTLTILTYWLKIDLHDIIGSVIKPILKFSDSWFSVILIVFMITFFWSFGIHGDSIVGSVVRPLWLMLLEQNATALANGQPVPHIAAEPLYQWFVWIGGSGTTIGFALLLLFKSKSAKSFPNCLKFSTSILNCSICIFVCSITCNLVSISARVAVPFAPLAASIDFKSFKISFKLPPPPLPPNIPACTGNDSKIPIITIIENLLNNIYFLLFLLKLQEAF